jgi:Domain of unknown function (DUF4188)
MPRMMQELHQHPELGFISGHFWLGRTTIAVQYCKSFEALTRYAKQPDLAHSPAWAQFRRNIDNSGDVGIWHETYLIAPGQYENIYHNMPTFGLGQASQLVEASGRLESAEGPVSPVMATAGPIRNRHRLRSTSLRSRRISFLARP